MVLEDVVREDVVREDMQKMSVVSIIHSRPMARIVWKTKRTHE